MSIPAKVSTSVDANRLPAARPLLAEDLAELCEIDVKMVRESLETRPKGSNTAVALIPDIDVIRWHHAREDFVGIELHGKAPEIKGAMVGTEKGKRVWCYWTRMWYNQNPRDNVGNTLHILRLVIEDESHSSWEGSGTKHTDAHSAAHSHGDAVAALLLTAQREAEEWKMEKVEAWNPSAEMLAGAKALEPSAKIVDRDMESIASLKWYPAHEGPVADTIDWIGNEKYGWC